MSNFELGPMGVLEHPCDRPSSVQSKYSPENNPTTERVLSPYELELQREVNKSSAEFLEAYINKYGSSRVPAILKSDLEFFRNELANTDSEGNPL